MVDVAGADVVAVLTRAPSAGGKTRLFAALGVEPDDALIAALLADTVDAVSGASAKIVAVVTPSQARDEVAALLPQVDVVAQPEGTLGERMRETMRTLFDAGARRVAIIGSDLPTISSRIINRVFAELDADPDSMVIGPAHDGGYYLISAATVPPVFDRIEWSTASVLADTRARADAAGIAVHVVDTLADVDTPADLRAVCAAVPRSRTAAWARRHAVTE